MTTHFPIIAAWINSCETDLQLDNVGNFIADRLITDDKTRDDLIDYLHEAIKRREWCAAKVANRDMNRVERFPACDEYQPTDIIN
jgi:transposase